MQPVLTLKKLTKTFKQGERALNVLKGVSFELQPGELVALVGSSGSGKSTLLQIAGLLDQASSGDIMIDGDAMAGESDKVRTRVRREKLGFVYQFHRLLPDLTALENVTMAGRIQGMSEAAAEESARKVMDAMGLGARLDHTPARLSGGEQQRTAIARALIGNPLLILADEPTGNLDDSTSERVFTALTEAVRARGVTALIATHDRRLAAKADRILTLHDGLITENEDA